MADIVLTDSFVQTIAQNQEVRTAFPFVSEYWTRMSSAGSGGRTCCGGGRTHNKAKIINELRGALFQMTAPDVARLKTILGVPGRTFSAYIMIGRSAVKREI